MAVPALIQNVPESALTIAGLTLLDRLVMTLHRAGGGPIGVVTRGPLPMLRRARALGIPVTILEREPSRHPGTLLARANLVVLVAEAREVIRQQGRLIDSQGTPLSLRFVGADQPFEFPGDANASDGAAVVRAGPVAGEIRDAVEAREAGRRLWASLTSSSDGLVDRWFNRPCGRPLSRLLVLTPVTPNQISVASTLIGLAGAWLLAQGNWREAVLGALLFQLSSVVDCVDGDVARMVFKETALGKWVDLVGDQVVHAGVFIGIAAGLMRAGTSTPAGWLALSAVAGGLLSFAVVLRGMLGRVRPSGRLQELIDRATNRDFSVIVLGLALGDVLEWFLWMAAIGSHVFWMTALLLQARASGAEKPEPEAGSRG